MRLIDVAIDRLNAGYDRNWPGFHKRRWQRAPDAYAAFVRQTLAARSGPERADALAAPHTPDDAKRLLRALARRVWDAPFENYSRFTGRMLAYKTGDETVRNMAQGAGGICSEKVQALKFLTDKLGLSSRYVLAGANARPPLPEDKLREMLTTFDFRFSKRYMRYWKHVALAYNIGGEEILVDATNGNVPFLFLEGDDAQRLLRDDEGKQPLPVRMALQEERFYYHHVNQGIVEDLYFAMEGWIEDADLMQVFDNELGLCITPRYFVAPVAYRNGKAFERIHGQYDTACEDAALRHEVSREWTLDTPLGTRFAAAEPAAASAVMASQRAAGRARGRVCGRGPRSRPGRSGACAPCLDATSRRPTCRPASTRSSARRPRRSSTASGWTGARECRRWPGSARCPPRQSRSTAARGWRTR